MSTIEDETIASEVLAASLGGAISASVLYPLEVLKTKLQAHDKQQQNDSDEDLTMIQFAKQLYKKEGIRVFWKGMETSAFQSALEKALYFFAYTALKQLYAMVRGPQQSLDGLSNLALGCAAEWAHLPITLPVDAWTTRIQTSNETPMAILMAMLSSKDEHFYKGISAYTILCFKPALQYTVFEQVKRLLVASRKHKSLNSAEAFLLGMVARTVATVLVFPFLRAKVVMQTHQQQQSSTNEKLSLLKLLQQVYAKDGLSGLFQGLGPELTRGIFSAALMLMIKERIADWVRQKMMVVQRSAGQRLKEQQRQQRRR